MEHYSDQVGEGLELLDLLFDKNDGILRHETMGPQIDQLWPVQAPHMMMPAQGNEDFFSALLDGYDSVSGSPVWSPSPSDSGTSEDPHSDHIESPPPTASPLLNPRIVVSQAQHNLDTNFPFNFNGWETGFFPDRAGGMQRASETPQAQPNTGFPRTIKDLLLSGTPEPVSLHSGMKLGKTHKAE